MVTVLLGHYGPDGDLVLAADSAGALGAVGGDAEGMDTRGGNY